MKYHAAFALAILSLASRTADAQTPLVAAHEAELIPFDAEFSAFFGRALDIDGDTLVTAAPEDGVAVGAVYVYTRTGMSWSFQEKLLPSTTSGNPRFGTSLDLDGDRLVVGAPGSDLSATNAGAAYVFERSGGTWTELSVITATVGGVDDGSSSDGFGSAVAISGDRLVVGAAGDDDVASNAGSAYVYLRSGMSWTDEAKLLPGSLSAEAAFGSALAMDGDLILAGAYRDDAPIDEQGSVFVFERSGANWNEIAQLVHPTAAVDDHFGFSVGLSGQTAVVGAPGVDDPGAGGEALVFEPIGGFWAFQAALRPADVASFDAFGTSVAIDGDIVAVGADLDDDAGNASGSTYVFARNGFSWNQAEKIVNCSAVAGDECGTAVALSDRTVATGAPLRDNTTTNSGGVFVEVLSSGQFTPYGFGDGSGNACPCANDSLPGMKMGCTNSSGFGARLSARGSDSVNSDDLILSGCGFVPLAPALLFAGPMALAGVSFGDGLRVAAGGGLKRLSIRVPNPQGEVAWGPGLLSIAGFAPGDTRHFQAWYRDPSGPCGSGFNLSNGVTATFQ